MADTKAAAEGTAADATVVLTEEERHAADVEAGRLAGEAELRVSAARKVKAAEVAVEKAEATLTGAEDALAQAMAEQEGLD